MNNVQVCVYPHLGALCFDRMGNDGEKHLPGGAVIVELSELELSELFDMSDADQQARLNELRCEIITVIQ